MAGQEKNPMSPEVLKIQKDRQTGNVDVVGDHIASQTARISALEAENEKLRLNYAEATGRVAGYLRVLDLERKQANLLNRKIKNQRKMLNALQARWMIRIFRIGVVLGIAAILWMVSYLFIHLPVACLLK